MVPYDLHALATPPAFVLSQDQTLQFVFRSRPGLATRPFGFEKELVPPVVRWHWLSLLICIMRTRYRTRRACAPGIDCDRTRSTFQPLSGITTHLAAVAGWLAPPSDSWILDRGQVVCSLPVASRSHGVCFTLFTCQRSSESLRADLFASPEGAHYCKGLPSPVNPLTAKKCRSLQVFFGRRRQAE